jgi:predicted RND superfamily exporter protein
MAGMLGLTLSTFAPTARFGWLMMALLLAALAGDLIMLPALVRIVCGGRRSRRKLLSMSNKGACLKRAA